MPHASGAKARIFPGVSGTAEQAAEKLIARAKSCPQALKRRRVLNGLAARVELVPFPEPNEKEFFRSL